MAKSEEKKVLLREIALAAEKAYRRGFQHGFHAARGELGVDAPSADQVLRWRFSKITNCLCAPGTKWAGKANKLIERLELEVSDNCPLLREMLQDNE